MRRFESLRASDADRDAVTDRLREAAGEGRLEPEELEERVHAALRARTYGELGRLVADLPSDRETAWPGPPSRGGAYAIRAPWRGTGGGDHGCRRRDCHDRAARVGSRDPGCDLVDCLRSLFACLPSFAAGRRLGFGLASRGHRAPRPPGEGDGILVAAGAETPRVSRARPPRPLMAASLAVRRCRAKA